MKCNEIEESAAIFQCGCSPGASLGADTCESACGADPECDELEPGINWLEKGVRKVCNSTCQYYETCIEDINLDKKVDIIDVAIAAKAFGSKSGEDRWKPNADIDENGIINIIDVAKVAIQFGKSCKEPTSLGLGYFSIIAILITAILIVIIFGVLKIFMKRL